MKSLFVMIAIAIVVVAVVFLLTSLFRKSRRSRPSKLARKPISEAEKLSMQWRAVKIAPGLVCCDAVSELTDQVFLSRLSPTLPLESCTEKDCRCKYIHLEDRRRGGDRRVELGDLGAYLPVSKSERRRQTDRREAELST
ncbi:MAG: hypothetical protein OEN02_13495 [Gammaproteobacteria bacterium]|nr:hypothetical protein [Gammaproteobacteria bacterium]MDH3534801.1 hypothetical protein [Gammaproteobacteria bacterium]